MVTNIKIKIEQLFAKTFRMYKVDTLTNQIYEKKWYNRINIYTIVNYRITGVDNYDGMKTLKLGQRFW